MATIQSTLALNDRMTATFSSITKAMNSTLTAMRSIKNQDIGEEFNQAAADIRLAENAVDDFNSSLDKNNSSLNKNNGLLATGIANLVSWYAILKSSKAVMDMSDTYVQTQARLDMINDGQQTLSELENQIYRSAQRSRASYNDTADAVAKLQMRAGDAFKTNAETIQFTENLNKIYAIGGTAQQEMASATLQLSQALGSGVLRGEEFNAVFEAAPMVMQLVADYMDVPIGKLRELAADGEISANVVKNALLGATDEINEKFEKMPQTFAQTWTKFTNSATKAFQPFLKTLNDGLQRVTSFFDYIANNSWILYGLAAGAAAVAAELIFYNAQMTIAKVLTDATARSAMLLGLKFIIIAAAVAIIAAGLIYLWNTNDTVAYWLLYAWDMLVVGAMALKLGATQAFYAIILAGLYMWLTLETMMLGIVTIFYGLENAAILFEIGIEAVAQGVVNAFLWMYNEVIKLLNKLGFEFEQADYADFTSATVDKLSQRLEEQAKVLTDGANEMTDVMNKIDEVQQKMQDTAYTGATDIQNTVNKFDSTRDQRIQEREKLGLDTSGVTTDISDAIKAGLSDFSDLDSSGSKALKTTTSDDLISDEDIQLLLDVATRDYKLSYQQVTPQITLTFGDIHETADVDGILDEVATRLEEIYDGNLEVE